MKEKRRRIPVNIRIAIRMALLIVGVSLSLIFAALAINAKKYRTAQLDIFKMRGRNAGRSVALLLDSNKVISFIDQVREIYENAPAELRDTPADPDAMYKYAVEDGAYEALFAPVETPAYLKMRDDLEEMARETGVIDINIFFIDYERHRKVFVMYAIGDEKYRDLYTAPGYWVDIYDFIEEYAKGGDPDYKGFYTDYMIENSKVRTLESIVPYFDHAAGNISTFVAVEQRWKVMDDERVNYTRRFFLSMSAFTLILTLLSEGVLQFAVIRPLNRLTEKQTRMSTELDLAANLQLSMLPVQTARQLGADGYDIHARLTPAREVGGDF
ncbi:MAG: hypothetical protein IJT32_04105, partial [Lachnospiraceae bacterium]|nr:hypothetical protein [Lachnospiraceae bacterium]